MPALSEPRMGRKITQAPRAAPAGAACERIMGADWDPGRPAQLAVARSFANTTIITADAAADLSTGQPCMQSLHTPEKSSVPSLAAAAPAPGPAFAAAEQGQAKATSGASLPPVPESESADALTPCDPDIGPVLAAGGSCDDGGDEAQTPAHLEDICFHPEAERSTRDLVHSGAAAADTAHAPTPTPAPASALHSSTVPSKLSTNDAESSGRAAVRAIDTALASVPSQSTAPTASSSPHSHPMTPTVSITPTSPEIPSSPLPHTSPRAPPKAGATNGIKAHPALSSSGSDAAFSNAAEVQRERTREKRPKRVLKGYILGKTLGQGSMGKVKLATVATTNERVAVKMVPRHTTVGALYEQVRRRTPVNGPPPGAPAAEDLPQPQIGPEGEILEEGEWPTPPHSALVKAREKDAAKELRAMREGSLQLLLYHPYVCGVRELIVQPHFYYLVEEFVSGGQMLDYIIAHSRLREKVARKFARQLTSALRYLHANNVVHRDLKIENILLSEQGHVKLVDFGLANLWSPHRALRTFCGSLYFAAPELLRARPYVGPEVDVWSLGVVLFVLVAGRVPFDDPSIAVLHKLIQQGQVQYPSHLSSECRHVLSRMLTVNPRKRAALSEISAHPWLTSNGHDPELDTHIPRRMPLRPEELDKNVIRHMQGFAFGDVDEIERKLMEILTSDTYLATLAGWDNQRGKSMGPDSLAIAPRDPPRPPAPRPVGDPQVSKSDAGEPLPVDDGELPPPDPATLDPTAGFHPMISIYYLVKEKLEREETQGGTAVFADVALQASPGTGSTPSLSGDKAPVLGSSMPTSSDIPSSPSMSGFGSNTLPESSKMGKTSSSGPKIGGWGLPVPQRPPETMRWSRGLEMPGMASGLGDVGITIPPAPLRGLGLGPKRDDDVFSPVSPAGSADTLTTPMHGRASTSSRPFAGRRGGSDESITTETSIRPYSPASVRVPVFDQDLRDRSRPIGEMRGPPRSRDGGTALEHTLLSGHSNAMLSLSSPRSPVTNGLPSNMANSRTSISSNPRTSFGLSRAPSSAISPAASPNLGRSRSSASSSGRHSRGLTLGSWWSGTGTALSTVPSPQEDRSLEPPLDVQMGDPALLGIAPPRRAASMHNRSVSTAAPPRGSSHAVRQRAEAPPIVMRSSDDELVSSRTPTMQPQNHLAVPEGPQLDDTGGEKVSPLKKLGAFVSRSIALPFSDTPTLEGKAEAKPEATPEEELTFGTDARPVFLKGLLSVSATSTKSPAQIQALLASALKRMSVRYTLIPGGFSCQYQPSIAPVRKPVRAEDEGCFVGATTATTPLSFEDKPTLGSDPAPQKKMESGSSVASASSVGTSLSVQSQVTAEALEELTVQFELCVVKVPFVGVSGVQVRRIAGDAWQYQVLAKQIIEEAQVRSLVSILITWLDTHPCLDLN